MIAATETDLRHWREAWEQGQVPDDLYKFTGRVLGAAAGTGTLPPSLSPGGEWSREACEDVLQGFWEAKLLKGGLARAFDRAQSPSRFARYLEQSLRNWLIDEARSSGAPRIPSRVQSVLGSADAFARYATAPQPVDEHWGLASEGWDALAPYAGDPLALTAELYAVGEIRLLPPTEGRRADALMTNDELERAMIALFGRIEAWLTPANITQAIRERFPTYFPGQQAGEDEAAQIPDTDVSIPELLDAEAAARQALAAMTDRQLAILRGRLHSGMTFEQLAEAHGCSRGTADNEFRRATIILREVASPDDVAEVWRKILDLSS